MSKWVEFYKNRMNEIYYEHVCTKYKRFIDEIIKETTNYSIIVEFGCGMANITRALIAKDPYVKNNKHYILDNDAGMLNLAIQNLAKTGNDIEIFKMDARDSYLIGDIAHSHGLLEHFNDKAIKQIIRKQRLQYKKVFHYVPSTKYRVPSFGDERLLTPEQWKEICNPDEIIEFNDGYDLILIWR